MTLCNCTSYSNVMAEDKNLDNLNGSSTVSKKAMFNPCPLTRVGN